MCLNHATEVIRKCNTVSETRQIEQKIKGKIKSGVRHELACEVQKGVEIRVIIEKIGTGNPHFLSVMPHNNKSKPSKTQKTPRKGV
jgi:hypothetical protein